MTSHLCSCTAYPQNPMNTDTHTHTPTPTPTNTPTHTHTRHYAKIYWVTLYKSIMAVHHSLAQKRRDSSSHFSKTYVTRVHCPMITLPVCSMSKQTTVLLVCIDIRYRSFDIQSNTRDITCIPLGMAVSSCKWQTGSTYVP